VHTGGVGTLLGPEGSAAEAGGPAPSPGLTGKFGGGLGSSSGSPGPCVADVVAGGRGGCGSCQVDSGREHLAASPLHHGGCCLTARTIVVWRPFGGSRGWAPAVWCVLSFFFVVFVECL
jgi:hypothetical protein